MKIEDHRFLHNHIKEHIVLNMNFYLKSHIYKGIVWTWLDLTFNLNSIIAIQYMLDD